LSLLMLWIFTNNIDPVVSPDNLALRATLSNR
jgi:hypothetical protein